MAARADTPTVIALRDLEACTGVRDIFALLRKLRYPVEDEPYAVALEGEDLPGRLRDGVSARYLVARVGSGGLAGRAVSVTLFTLRGDAPARPLIRGIAQAWTRRFPGEHLLIFAAPDGAGTFQQITFVNARRLGEGAEVRIKLHKLVVERAHPTRHDLDTLNGIALADPAMTADVLYKAQCKAFDVDRLTEAFYKEYARRFREAMARIKSDNRGVAAFQSEDATALHTFTQRLFGRLMFLYFLQKKGALNSDPNFITNWYRKAVSEGDHFYQGVLEPLFFETLNRPRGEGLSARFGRVPYLNGGLFAEDEDDHKGDVYIANEVFDAAGEGGLLYFLNRHNFTVEEDTPLEVQVALDPEMLGKVFENLLEAEERGKGGTFYTPRAVVAFMCREALAAYLERAAGLAGDQLGWLLDEAETGEPARDADNHERLSHATLPRARREAIERALAAVRVLDPAVGSGAFPLGMLALLIGVRRALYRMADVAVGHDTHLVEGWKRDYIRDCLYGVDVKREAVEIARLRLWLSLVVDADPFAMEPLPNLDYKLMEGDSLIETFQGVEIYPTRPQAGPAQGALLGGEATRQLIAQLHDLQSAYFQPDTGGDRAALRQKIRDTEAEIVAQSLAEKEDQERIAVERINAQLAALRGKPQPPALLAELARLDRSVAATDEAKRDLKAGKTLPFFLYRLHFGDVFARENGGFDIVIANPPYVSIERMARAYKQSLTEEYPDVAAGRADLYVYFYARALQLLRTRGTLAFISSNKFLQVKYGKGLRAKLTEATTMRDVVDFGNARIFMATAEIVSTEVCKR